MGGGGGGLSGEYYSFEVTGYKKEWEGVCPSYGGDFFWTLGYKSRFLVRYKGIN